MAGRPAQFQAAGRHGLENDALIPELERSKARIGENRHAGRNGGGQPEIVRRSQAIDDDACLVAPRDRVDDRADAWRRRLAGQAVRAGAVVEASVDSGEAAVGRKALQGFADAGTGTKVQEIDGVQTRPGCGRHPGVDVLGEVERLSPGHLSPIYIIFLRQTRPDGLLDHFVPTVMHSWDKWWGPSALATLLLLQSAPGATVPMSMRSRSRWPGASAVILLSSTSLYRVLGERGLVSMERLMGMLLVMVSVQKLLNGLRTSLVLW